MSVVNLVADAPLAPDAHRWPRLLADIGGTNARFALQLADRSLHAIRVLACEDYASIALAIAAYLAHADVRAIWGGASVSPIRHAAIAIANPVDGDQIQMTNHHWGFSIEALRQHMGWQTLVVVNDFTALAMSLPLLGAEQRIQIGGGTALPERAIGILGPGTGLGVSGIVRAGSHWVALHSEGGHVSFSPADEREIFLLRYLWREFPHVSAERLISGRGLAMTYLGLAERAGRGTVEPLAAAAITAAALEGDDALCSETVECFCAMLGTVAGNLAVTLGAQGGIYIGGGIIPRLGPLFAQSPFRARFEAKGRFVSYLGQIPTFVITAEYPAFLGAAAVLDERLCPA